MFAGPSLPYGMAYISHAMATSPDGGGVILFGGYSNGALEDTLLELRFDADNWTTLPQKLKQHRRYHVVIPISYI